MNQRLQMNNNPVKFNRCYIAALFMLLVTLFATPARALNVTELVDNKKLSVNIRLSTSNDIIAKQAVTLEIELLTNRWFGSGNRVEPFDFANMVVLPSTTAINGSKQIAGETWVSQIREIVIYPMEAGIYELPPINVHVAVNTENHGIVSGVIATQSMSFEVIKPQALSTIEEYVVSSNFTVDVDGEFKQDEAYKIGEAVTLTYSFNAENVPGMMLPTLAIPKIDGLSIYHKPPQLNDRNVRGTLTGKKTESISLIFEKPGNYTIPEQVFYWWNNATNALESITISEKKWQVSSELLSNESTTPQPIVNVFNFALLPYIVLAIIMALLLWKISKYRVPLVLWYSRVSKKSERQYKKTFIKAVSTQQYQLACQQLYLLMNEKNSQTRQSSTHTHEKIHATLHTLYEAHSTSLVILGDLLACAYDKQNHVFTQEQAKSLLQSMSIITIEEQKNMNKELLSLNPK